MSININFNGMQCYPEQAAAKKQQIERIKTVREQSNEIAGKLRNKVRDAQKQELKRLQKESEKELGEWKRRSHSQIQAKIDECVKAFGNAHIAAIDASCEENELLRQDREEQDLLAATRGRKAMLQVQREREKQAEERLSKKKKHNQKTIGIQADFLAQRGFSESLANKKSTNHAQATEEEEDESNTFFTSKPNLHKHSIKINNNYNPQNFTTHSVDSSNNCDSDEIDDLDLDDVEENQTQNESEVEFNQITNLLKHRATTESSENEREVDEIIVLSASESTSSIEILAPRKKTSVKKHSPKKKSIIKKSPNKKTVVKSNKVKAVKSPAKKTTKSKDEENRVTYVDYTNNKYETTYIPSKNLITRSEKPKFNAMQEAQVQTDDHMISKRIDADILQRLTDIRSQEALEKEKIRRDYEKLRLELDELTKLEQEARAKTNAFKNLSRDQLLRKEDEKQKKMNLTAENAMRGNIITCPPVERKEKSSAKQKSNVNNVAAFSSTSTSRPVESLKVKKPNEELNNIVKVERLKDLLEKINHQKRLLLNEIEKSEDVPGPDLEKVMECLRKLEKEKAVLDGEDKVNEVKKQQLEELTERERKVKEREERLDNKIRDLFKKQNEAKFQKSSSVSSNVSPPKSDSETASASSGEKKIAQAPVEIIIKVQQPKSPSIKKPKKSYRFIDTLNREPGRVYPKTPIRKKKTEEVIEINDLPEKPEPEKLQQQTQTSPADSNAPKPILKNSQIKQISIPSKISQQPPTTQPTSQLNKADTEDLSLSTVYRELPPKIHINNQEPAQQKKPRALNPTLTHYITRLLGMSKNIGSQLNVDVSSVSTPGSSTINTSANISSINEINFNDERMEQLQKFIDDNNSFLTEVNETLEKVQTRKREQQEKNLTKGQSVWGDVLPKKKSATHDNQSKASSSQVKSAATKTAPSSSASAIINTKSQLPQSKPKEQIQTNASKPSIPKTQRPQSLPIHNRPQLSTEEMDKVTKYLESKMMNNYKEYTENCQKRIAELTKMMEQVRQEKMKLIENSLSSNENNNFTEYKDIVHGKENNAAVSSKDSPPSNREDPPSEEINNILRTQSRPFGMSKDSGIASSRPVTSSDFRDSPDARATSEENNNVFEPILKDIPKPPRIKLTSTEGNTETIKNVSLMIKQQQEEKKRQMKPPLSIKSFSPQIDKQHEGHELSTIAEIETPSASKVIIVPNEENVEVADLNSFPNFEEYAKNFGSKEVELSGTSFPDMNSLKNALPDLKLQTFDSPSHYGIVELSRDVNEDDKSVESESRHSSLMDIEQALKDRNLLERSFQLHFDEEGGVNLLEANNRDDKTTPTATHQVVMPSSPKRKPAQSRIVINTPENLATIEIVTPTKVNRKPSNDKREPQSPKSSDTMSGIQEIENDLQCVGIKWAANVLRRTEESQLKESSSSSDGKRDDVKVSVSFNASSTSSSEGRPLNLKEFLARELISKNKHMSDDSSLSSRFLKSFLNASSASTSSSSNPKTDSTSNAKLRTSTPVRMSSEYIARTGASSQLFVGAESVSTLKDCSDRSTDKSDKENIDVKS